MAKLSSKPAWRWRQLSLRFKLFVIMLCALLIGASVYIVLPKPDLIVYQSYSFAVYDKQNKLLRLTLAKDQRYRLYTPISDIADNLIRATVLYEDKSFYQHFGVDYQALLRAFWQTYIKRERRVGASTITMQVARLRWQITTKTIRGKLLQIYRAIQLSRHYSKTEILEAYLNLAPYGGNIEGIGAASLIYFGKDPSELSLPEALTLAVVPQNPNKRNPAAKQGLTALQSAKNDLYNRWVDSYPEQAISALKLKLPLKVRTPSDLPFLAPHFVDSVLQQQAKFAYGNIHTSLDYPRQAQLDVILKDYVRQHKLKGFNNASALLLNTQTMQIEAMLGSADFQNNKIDGQVNGTLAKRSPGSTLKPFVYGLALDAGLIHPMTMLKDLPKRYAGFTPENFGGGFLGPISAQDALVTSRNLPVVELQKKLSEALSQTKHLSDKTRYDLYTLLENAQISDLRSPEFYGLALSLGGAELTMLELVQLYAMLPNNGRFNKARFTHKKTENENTEALLSPEAAFLVLDMLSKNPLPNEHARGLSNYTQRKGIAWKTGTSWAFRDAWAIGVKGKYVLAVWIGNFKGGGNNAFVGRSAAGPLLFKMFSAIGQAVNVDNNDKKTVIDDLDVQRVAICKTTGDLYEDGCPEKTYSWFIPGVSPIKQSNIYRTILIDPISGLRSCSHLEQGMIKKTFAFWPTDFVELFNKAQIFIERPPGFTANCNKDKFASFGIAPSIVSPQNTLDYIIQDSKSTTVPIELKATADADVNFLYWFANGRLIASRELTEDNLASATVWQAPTGEHELQVSDDLGRSDSVIITVGVEQ